MAVIGIRYNDGGNPLNYECVTLRYTGNEDVKEFKSGNFVKDWFDCKKFVIDENILDNEPFGQSSSVNHFIMDGAPHESAYLHIINGEPVLKYIDKTDNYLENQREVYQDGWEYFVESGTRPTWNELRVICGLEPLKEK